MSKKIFVILLGESPEILTMTLWSLKNRANWTPDEIVVITSVKGVAAYDKKKEDIQDAMKEMGLNGIKTIGADKALLNANDIVFSDHTKNFEKSLEFIDVIATKIRELKCEDKGCEIVLSITAGPRHLAYWSGTALGVFGDIKDRVTHIIVPDQWIKNEIFTPPPGYESDLSSVLNPNFPITNIPEIIKKGLTNFSTIFITEINEELGKENPITIEINENKKAVLFGIKRSNLSLKVIFTPVKKKDVFDKFLFFSLNNECLKKLDLLQESGKALDDELNKAIKSQIAKLHGIGNAELEQLKNLLFITKQTNRITHSEMILALTPPPTQSNYHFLDSENDLKKCFGVAKSIDKEKVKKLIDSMNDNNGLKGRWEDYKNSLKLFNAELEQLKTLLYITKQANRNTHDEMILSLTETHTKANYYYLNSENDLNKCFDVAKEIDQEEVNNIIDSINDNNELKKRWEEYDIFLKSFLDASRNAQSYLNSKTIKGPHKSDLAKAFADSIPESHPIAKRINRGGHNSGFGWAFFKGPIEIIGSSAH